MLVQQLVRQGYSVYPDDILVQTVLQFFYALPWLQIAALGAFGIFVHAIFQPLPDVYEQIDRDA